VKRVDGLQAGLDATSGKVAASDQILTASLARLDQAEAGLKQQGERLAKNETDDAAISATAKEALDRATAAGKLAEGKLVYEAQLSEELTGFAANQAVLSESARQTLKQFADKLVAENKGVYLEIQGYTDTSGSAARNLRLSRERAEAVRAYLHEAAGVSLHRMAVMAYGEAKPIADNATPDGRSKNRRVVIVVLK
jgi:outer membrane protein OmpA-like peptidoglycan-associated protein